MEEQESLIEADGEDRERRVDGDQTPWMLMCAIYTIILSFIIVLLLGSMIYNGEDDRKKDGGYAVSISVSPLTTVKPGDPYDVGYHGDRGNGGHGRVIHRDRRNKHVLQKSLDYIKHIITRKKYKS